ncbi:mitochondrial escape protein 2 [Borealophlyctis nickersoniae]|nr:mitochondrial escape protein 2 [Borealophlyctis nickersoniae]
MDAARAANARLIPAKFTHPFTYVGAQPSWKEGGLFVHFKYEGGNPQEAVDTIIHHINEEGLRSWTNLKKVKAFLVQGTPWVDDMIGRLPSDILKVEFEGPDLDVETLYREFRHFGKIADITPPPAGSKDVPRFALIDFMHVRSATSARNCLHGKKVKETRMSIGYQKVKSKWQVWEWITSHPRIMIPVVLGILAGLTYVVFDPIRVFFISSKLRGRWDLERYTSTAEQLWDSTWSALFGKWFGNFPKRPAPASTDGWTERQAEEERLRNRLKQTPDTLILVSGPRGSGKSGLVRNALSDKTFKLTINCEELVGQSDYVMMKRLANQIHFYPMFNAMVQASNIVDTMVTATTGAKAGLSTTAEGQIRKMLDCLSVAINRVTLDQKRARDKVVAQQKLAHAAAERGQDAAISEETQKLIDEPLPEVEYPVIVVEGFLEKENAKGHNIYNMLMEWAAMTAEYHLAHIIFVSDNPSAVKALGRALSNKLVENYSLSDATPETAMSFIKRRMGKLEFGDDLLRCVEAIGGRLTDLELLIQKMNAGMSPIDAFNDLVLRTVTEIRKIGLNEDQRDQGNYVWSAVQFWKIVQLLSKTDEISYDEVRFHPLFKGEETPLQGMERAGLISLVHQNGRPYGVRLAKPIYRTAFQHMQGDERQTAIMGILTTKQLIADEEEKIKKLEHEVTQLVGSLAFKEVRSEVRGRLEYLGKSIASSSQKVKQWSREQAEWKKKVTLKE